MKIIKDSIRENDKFNSIELVKGDKHMKMTLNCINDLCVSFSYDEDKKGLFFLEEFSIGKEDKELYNLVDSLFFSYGKEAFFDTLYANLYMAKEEDKYSFFFINEMEYANKEIRCVLEDTSVENNSMKRLFAELQNFELAEEKEEKVENSKSLSKTLNNILKK